MEKDLKRLREAESETQRTKIAIGQLKSETRKNLAQQQLGVQQPQPEAQFRQPNAPTDPKPAERQIKELMPEIPPAASLIPKFPKKARGLKAKKFLIRMGLVVFFFLLIGLLTWFVFVSVKIFMSIEKDGSAPSAEPQEETPSEATSTPEIIVPPSLIDAARTEILIISPEESASSSLSAIFNKSYPRKGEFVRIIIKDPEINAVWGLKEFFNLFEIIPPVGFLENLNNDFTLFVYPAETANQMGFVAETINAAGASNLMLGWEATIENDTEALFAVLGKTSPALRPTFRQTTFVGTDFSFRYLTISKDDFGICYKVTDDYLLFTTSFEGMKKLTEEF